jgi:uncharacterized membrane protein YccC
MIGRLLKYFGQDGLTHILVSLVLCAVLGVFLPLWAAVLITLSVGFIKELVWDLWMEKGTAEWRDIVSDAVGILLGVLIIILYTLWN